MRTLLSIRMLAALVVATVLLGAGWLSRREPQPGPVDSRDVAPLAAAPSTADPARSTSDSIDHPEPTLDQPRGGIQTLPAQAADTPALPLLKAPGQSPLEAARLARSKVQSWTFDDYRALVDSGQPIDGEIAYTAYQFARACASGITTETEMLRRHGQYRSFYENNRERLSREQLDRALDQIETSLVHCQGMGDDVLDVAMDWLLLAAELEYLPAQIRFPEDGFDLLNEGQWTVFRRPDLLEMYRQRAPETLQQALGSGHPEAFLAYANALKRGLIFDRDPVQALAMELVAGAVAGQPLPTRVSDPNLSPGQNDDALAYARVLCRQHCR